MTYLPSSIREAYSMSNKAIKQALAPYVLYGLKRASRDELISMWLEKYGVKELEPAFPGFGYKDTGIWR